MRISLSADTFVEILSDLVSKHKHQSYCNFFFISLFFLLQYQHSRDFQLTWHFDSFILFSRPVVYAVIYTLFDQYLIIAILLCNLGQQYPNIIPIFSITNTKIITNNTYKTPQSLRFTSPQITRNIQ